MNALREEEILPLGAYTGKIGPFPPPFSNRSLSFKSASDGWIWIPGLSVAETPREVLVLDAIAGGVRTCGWDHMEYDRIELLNYWLTGADTFLAAASAKAFLPGCVRKYSTRFLPRCFAR